MDNWLGALATVIVGVLALVGMRAVNKANSEAVRIETLQKLIDDKIAKHEKIIQLQDGLDAQKERTDKLERNNSALWRYVYSLIEFIKSHRLVPPSPPEEIKSDPKLMELLK